MRTRGWPVGCAGILLTAGLLGCEPTNEPLDWTRVSGPEGLFSTRAVAAWGPMAREAASDVVVYSTPAARGTYLAPLERQQRALAGQAGLLVELRRIAPARVSDDAWRDYVDRRLDLESTTHDALTFRTIVGGERRGHTVLYAVRHDSATNHGYVAVVRLEERAGILCTARAFVSKKVYAAHKRAIEDAVWGLDWSEVAADALLPDLEPIEGPPGVSVADRPPRG